MVSIPGTGRRSVLVLALLCALMAFGCDDDDSGDPQPDGGSDTTDTNTDTSTGTDTDGGSVTCTVTATATPDTAARTMTGVGLVECDGPAALDVETCVQWNPSGAFEDIQCTSSAQSGVAELQVDNLSSCGLGSGRTFRARVNATVDGVAQPEQLSAEVVCE